MRGFFTLSLVLFLEENDIAYSGTFQRMEDTELLSEEDIPKIITMLKECILTET